MSRRANDPYSNFRFIVELDGLEAAGFSECTGLQAEMKVFEYKEGGNNNTTLKFPEHASYGNITLKRGLIKSIDMLAWMLKIVNGEFQKTLNNSASFKRSINIVLKDEQGQDVRRWVVENAFPVKWTGPDLKASTSEVAFVTIEMSHEGVLGGAL